MSYRLPPQGSPLRELFSIDHILQLGTVPECLHTIPTLKAAVVEGRRDLAGDNRLGAINFFATTEHRTLVLLQVKRATAQVLWNFGPVVEPSKGH